MGLLDILNKKNITMYKLSMLSGVPKTTINDICSGKSTLEHCKAKTVLKIAQVLEYSVEELLLKSDEKDGKK